MKEWRLIISGRNNAPVNMSLDEALFASTISDESSPVIRLYGWSMPAMTIGYFQKHSDFSSSQLPIVRRMTGGLSVEHGKDVSYCFVASRNDWPFVADQEKNYQALHSAIGTALNSMGINCAFFRGSVNSGFNSICVKTFYPNDLILEGKKILGSCQRKRGNTLLVQGSIHLAGLMDKLDEFAMHLSEAFRKQHEVILTKQPVSGKVLQISEALAKNKYSADSWNIKY